MKAISICTTLPENTVPTTDEKCCGLPTSKPKSTVQRGDFRTYDWFLNELDDCPALLQIFRNSRGYAAILSFLSWAELRGYLNTESTAIPSQIEAATFAAMDAPGGGDSRVVLTSEQWEAAVDWQNAHEDAVLDGVERYLGKHSDVTCFIAWCLERNYLELVEVAR